MTASGLPWQVEVVAVVTVVAAAVLAAVVAALVVWSSRRGDHD